MTSIPAVTVSFLKDLSKNNEREWFQENQKYYKEAKNGFIAFIDRLIDRMQDFTDLGPLQAKDCMYRINRDLRFSKDKTPYNTHFSVLLAPGGKKTNRPFHYIKIKPDGDSEISGGFWTEDKKRLALVRQEIDYNGEALRNILSQPEFVKNFGELHGEKLKRPPKGYEADHPDIELLKMKYYVVSKVIGEDLYLSDKLLDNTLNLYKSMQPFLNFFDQALDG